MKRIVILPALLAIVVFALTSALVSRQAIAATSQNVTASTAGPDQPFKAQVAGLEWLNPLQRRDYPTEWQLLWTLPGTGKTQSERRHGTDRPYQFHYAQIGCRYSGWR